MQAFARRHAALEVDHDRRRARAARSAGAAVHAYASSGGAFQGSSSTPASIERPHRLASTEYGFSTVRRPARRWLCAKAIASGRESGLSRSGRERLQRRIERAHGQLDAHLIVALAGAAVRDGVGAVAVRRFDEERRRSAGARARPRADRRLRRARWRASAVQRVVVDEALLRIDEHARRSRRARALSLATASSAADATAAGGARRFRPRSSVIATTSWPSST